MGATITVKKGQLYISFTANRQRKLFAIRPTIKLGEKEKFNTETFTICADNRKLEKKLNHVLASNLNWFIETCERLEKFEKKQPTVAIISRLHREEFLTEKKTVPKTFEKALEDYFIYKHEIEGIKDKSLLQYSQNFGNRFRKFLDRYKYRNLEELDEHFLYRFRKHLLDLNYSSGTYSVTVDIFKNFCKHLLREKLISADVFLEAKEILKSKSSNNLKDFALTLEEVKDLCNFKGLTRVQTYYKDVFIFNCIAGGMRYSDLRKIRIGDVDLDKKLLHVYTQKNKKYITIPLISLAEDIIRKYNPDIDTTLQKDRIVFDLGTSLNSLNHRFKVIARKFYRINVNGEKVYPYMNYRKAQVETANKTHKGDYKPLYTFFKSSLCRRTFITCLIEQGYSYEVIRQYTSHSSYKAFSTYVKLTQKNKVETLQNAFASLKD